MTMPSIAALSGNMTKGARMLGSVLLAGCVVGGCAAFAPTSGSSPEARIAAALADGQGDKAIRMAEAAVLGAPHDAAIRAMLGRAYLDGGRLLSARDALNDATMLGDDSPRTALMLALAQIGTGQSRLAIATLEEQGNAIPAAERGLAFALAGETARGVQIVSDAIRAGDDSARTRQNLAYAFALDGRWRDARVMAAQDIAADMLDRRITEWAMAGRPDQAADRVAGLLDTTLMSGDPGQPAQLALTNVPPPVSPTFRQPVLSAEQQGELPPIAAMEPIAASGVEIRLPAMASPDNTKTPAIADTPAFAAEVPAPKPTSASPPRVRAPARVATAPDLPKAGQGGSHVAQLGSYVRMSDAKVGWAVFQSRYPNLRNVTATIGRYTANGRVYYRVAAAGFDARDAAAMCRAVHAGGHECLPIARERLGTPVGQVRFAKAG